MTRARVVVVVAHPDDETLGFGARLSAWQPRAVVVLTDGAPHDPSFFQRAGYGSRDTYARARHLELEAALVLAGIDSARLYALGVADQEAAEQLPTLIDRVAELLVETHATFVATHAYEGGHPDHDAAAFIVAEAVARSGSPAQIVEAPYYHDASGETVHGQFIARADAGAVDELRLTASQRERKRAMLACYKTQREVIARFDLGVERLRAAPRYDFGAPPHPGGLHYERWGWPLTGAAFRARAAAACRLARPLAPALR